MTASAPAILDPRFHECLRAAVANRDLLREYDRLYGSNLSMRGSPVQLVVDQVTGRLDAEFREFAEFVERYIYGPLVRGGVSHGG